ncbi:hypothetical protein EV426DRAFT_721497 [Tirmania nivea]|nr:hypothetical protein EV426DRAFT_721497 [Tirmania nivea]
MTGTDHQGRRERAAESVELLCIVFITLTLSRAVRREVKEGRELRQRVERRHGGEKETRKVRKKVVDSGGDRVNSQTGFAKVKRARLEGRGSKHKSGGDEFTSDVEAEEESADEEKEETEDDVERDGDWTE